MAAEEPIELDIADSSSVDATSDPSDGEKIMSGDKSYSSEEINILQQLVFHNDLVNYLSECSNGIVFYDDNVT